eukprot:gnl/Dysnectes_brevis/4420_a5935_835.p1 GENE.gnl/Dysnectes_brevis/4420_a5935_835~~gnl/Dysnectes_brevis/4420_a5935_835.p1  ORF type:complete len:1087 (+),score=173.79 gnl/Dysnectes_brevis/4420_a5935_835:32-3262(+)
MTSIGEQSMVADLEDYNDPLIFHPDEPRVYLSDPFYNLPALIESLFDYSVTITAAVASNPHLYVGLSNGSIIHFINFSFTVRFQHDRTGQPITDLKLSGDAKGLVSASRSGSVMLYPLHNYKTIKSSEIDPNHPAVGKYELSTSSEIAKICIRETANRVYSISVPDSFPGDVFCATVDGVMQLIPHARHLKMKTAGGALRLDRKAEILVVSCGDGDIILWHIPSKEIAARIPAPIQNAAPSWTGFISNSVLVSAWGDLVQTYMIHRLNSTTDVDLSPLELVLKDLPPPTDFPTSGILVAEKLASFQISEPPMTFSAVTPFGNGLLFLGNSLADACKSLGVSQAEDAACPPLSSVRALSEYDELNFEYSEDDFAGLPRIVTSSIFGDTSWGETIRELVTPSQTSPVKDGSAVPAPGQLKEMLDLVHYDREKVLIVGSSRILVARKSDPRDHVSWLSSTARDREALCSCVLLSDELNTSVNSVARDAAIVRLMDENPELSASLVEETVDPSNPDWQRFVFLFSRSGTLSHILPTIPTNSDVLTRFVAICSSLTNKFSETARFIHRMMKASEPSLLIPLLRANHRRFVHDAGIASALAESYIALGDIEEAVKLADAVDKHTSSSLLSALRPLLPTLTSEDPLLTIVVDKADALLAADPGRGAELLASLPFGASGVPDLSLGIVVSLVVGAVKKLLGLPPTVHLHEDHLENDLRNLRVRACEWIAWNGSVPPVRELTTSLYHFLHQLSGKSGAGAALACRDIPASFQDLLVSITAVNAQDEDSFKTVLSSCPGAAYGNVIRICKELGYFDSLVSFVTARATTTTTSDSKAKGPSASQGHQFFQSALEILLESNRDDKVRRAVVFIRRLEDAVIGNKQQTAVLRRAQLWSQLTRSVASSQSVEQLLKLTTEEHIPIDPSVLLDAIGDDVEIDDFHRSLHKIIRNAQMLSLLQRQCTILVKDDCIHLRERLVNETRSGIVCTEVAKCAHCGDLISNALDRALKLRFALAGDSILDIVPVGDIDLTAPEAGDVRAFRCGHKYHYECLEHLLAVKEADPDLEIPYHRCDGVRCPVCMNQSQALN